LFHTAHPLNTEHSQLALLCLYRFSCLEFCRVWNCFWAVYWPTALSSVVQCIFTPLWRGGES